ncbi:MULTISPECIES: TonB-dependent receptor [unclassified Sphingomonas]|uniref:TonB-dependent receptor domain-containing protein n=1 Tax=unclassified Sphingomonas TaxID=196159 RepID=UPI002269FACD|nr:MULTISPECIES: TonB-dependent receptor [unclassified Sphingomonas]
MVTRLSGRKALWTLTVGWSALAFAAAASAQQASQSPSTADQRGQSSGAAATTAAAPQDQTSQPDAGLTNGNVPAAQNDVVVTGSRIRRPSVDNAQPTTTLNADTLNNRGYPDVARAINELPGFGVPDSSLIGGQGNGFGVGQSFVNLYSLGSQRTLTLVNGRRFVGANPATPFSSAGAGTQVDLNTIPTKLIDRVETISIGGAPIYGSDAIAGTVNIILRKDYQGVDIDAQSGISQLGDLGNQRIRALVGRNFADGRGNITVDAEYNHDDGLVGSQRAITSQNLGFIQPYGTTNPASPFFQSPYSNVLVSNVRTFLGYPGGNPYFKDGATIRANQSVVNSAGQFVHFAPDGTLVPWDLGTRTNSSSTFLGGDQLNLGDISNLRVTDDRVNVTALANFKISDGIELFGEGWYSKNKATNLAGQPVYNTAFFAQNPLGTFDVNGNYIFKLSNPFLTDQARNIIRQNLITNGLPAGNDANFYVGRANTDLVSGVAKADQDLYRFVGGLRGDFGALGHKFTYEVSANYGRTKTRSIIPSLVEPNLRRALNVGRDANGNIVCLPFNPSSSDPTQPPLVRTDPNTPDYSQPYGGTISTTCAPLNLFGNGAPSQAAKDYVTTNAITDAITSQRDFLATLTGSLFTLPGGDLGVSVGYENRREYSRFSPDAYYTIPLGRSIPILGVEGSYITNELFGEMRAPLIGPDQHIPLVHELELNAAGRQVWNSLAGNAFTWTAGGRWSPIGGLAIRGNYTKAIRAPAVTELFSANQPAFDGGFDPCDASSLTSGPNPAVRQKNCSAAGLPTNFVSNIASFTQPITIVGNRNLRNEVAKSWTVGSVLTPRLLRGLSLSVDYIHIRVADTVVASSAANVLSGCYDSSNYPNSFYCGLIQRDQTPGENFGQVLTLQEPYINQGGLGFDGITAELSYRHGLGSFGMLTGSINAVHTLRQFIIIDSSTPRTTTRGNIGQSIDRVNVSLTYDKGPFSWFNQVEYIGPARFDVQDGANARDVTGVSSFTIWNTSLTLHVNDRFNFRVNVDNVTNRGIPYPATAGSGALNTYYQGLVGRAFLVGAGVHF